MHYKEANVAGLGKTELLVIYLLFTKKGWMSTGAIVDLLRMVNKSESAVRATLFRLRKKDIIKSIEKGRQTQFTLGKAGVEIVSGYMNRLELTEKKWNGKWLLFSFNVPERKRHLRNILRQELMFLGFGRLHTNLWVSPYDLRLECARIIRRLRLQECTVMFMSDYIGQDARKFANRIWHLEKFTRTWDEFKNKWQKECRRFRRTRFTDSYQEAVEALIRLIKMKEYLVSWADKGPSLPYDLMPYERRYHINLEKAIFDSVDFFRKKASSIIKFDPIAHEKHHR